MDLCTFPVATVLYMLPLHLHTVWSWSAIDVRVSLLIFIHLDHNLVRLCSNASTATSTTNRAAASCRNSDQMARGFGAEAGYAEDSVANHWTFAREA